MLKIYTVRWCRPSPEKISWRTSWLRLCRLCTWLYPPCSWRTPLPMCAKWVPHPQRDKKQLTLTIGVQKRCKLPVKTNSPMRFPCRSLKTWIEINFCSSDLIRFRRHLLRHKRTRRCKSMLCLSLMILRPLRLTSIWLGSADNSRFIISYFLNSLSKLYWHTLILYQEKLLWTDGYQAIDLFCIENRG